MYEIVCYALCFAAEGITAWAYFERIFDCKKKQSFVKMFFVLGYFILFLVSQIDNVIINGVCFIIVNSFLLYENYECKWWTGFLQVGYLTFVMGGTEILILSVFFENFNAYRINFSVMLTFTVIGRLMYFFIMQISARYIRPVKAYKDGSTVVLLAVMPLASVVIAIAFIHVGMNIEVGTLTGTLITVSILALLTINIFVVVIYNQMQIIHSEHLELELSAQKEQINTERYKLLQEQYEGQRVLIHDIRRHLHVINGLINEERISDLKKYLCDIENKPVLQNLVRICDHPVLNMILVHHAELCKSFNIDYHFVVRTNDFQQVSLHDITAIFDNLLANAIEAAKDSDEKIVDLCISPIDGDRILISIINSCDYPPEKNADGMFFTRKENKEKHGIGLRSVCQAIKRYDGISEMHYDHEEKRFHTVVQLTIFKTDGS